MRGRLAVAIAMVSMVSAFIAAPASAGIPGPPGSGYWMLDADGNVYAFGAAPFCGSPSQFGEFWGADIVPTPDGFGYWALDARGGVIGIACAGMPQEHQNAYHGDEVFDDMLGADEFAVSMSATPDGTGYWVFTDIGRVLAFGTAGLHGNLLSVHLNGPILDSVATPSGNGYWMVGSDGGVFSFGDAQFYGSMGGKRLNQPVMAMAPDPDGVGYWLVASDGGVFAFSAPFYGSTGGIRLNQPVSGMVASPTGHGYLMAAFDGGVFTFGDVPFHGSLGGHPPAADVYSIAVMP
jgi:hypothetical protein